MRLIASFLTTVAAACAVIHIAAQEIGGIGLALGVDKDGKSIKIVRVLPDTPSAAAGITNGMLLRKIGDVSTEGTTLSNCVALIRGPVGTKLSLEVSDPKTQQIRQVEVTRAKPMPVKKGHFGDPAAPVVAAEWIQGGPVNVQDGKNVYVVEFWATWCGPCRVTIPHLNELQKKLKDKGVVFVGVSDEDPEKVKPFVKEMGSQMAYAVACDDAQQTWAGYMGKFGFTVIPTVFIVGRDGRVRWLGDPMGVDKALERLLAGKLGPTTP